MSNEHDGGPAFPQPSTSVATNPEGMSLRDYFAAHMSAAEIEGISPTTIKEAAATVDLPLTTSGRLAVRATLDVDNGAAGWTTTFYTADSMSGTWTQLGSQVTEAGVTSIFSGTAALRLGSIADVSFDEAIGRVHAAQVRSGIGGTVVANPDFTAQTSGATSFADSAGLTWSTAGNASITNRKIRFSGEIASWTPRWETGGQDVICEVEAAGVLRRLGVGWTHGHHGVDAPWAQRSLGDPAHVVRGEHEDDLQVLALDAVDGVQDVVDDVVALLGLLGVFPP